jgi:hypothetical protein
MKKRSLSLNLMLTLMMGFVFTALTGVPLAVGQVISFGTAMMPRPTGVALDALNIADLNASLGAYLRENRDVLIAEVLLDTGFEDKFEVMDDVKDEVPLPRLTMTNIVQPGLDKTDWNPTANAIRFGARILKTRDLKVDLNIIPQVLEKTWLGYKNRKGSGGQNQFQMPFEEFIMRYIIAKAKEDIHLNSIYRGVYNAAGTTPIDTMDGLLHLISDEITATSMTPIVTGAITAVNVKEKLLLVYDGIDEAYKHKPTQMLVNSQIFDWYVRLHDPLANAYLVRQDVQSLASTPMLNMFPLFGTNCTLKREPGLGASQRVICTPKENMVYGVDSMDDSGTIMIEQEKRTLNLMMDFKAGVQLKEVNDKAIRVNDQA